VTISDLRSNVGLLQQSARHDPSKSKKNTRGNTSKEGSNFEDQDSDAERIGESLDDLITNRGGDTVEMMTVTKIRKQILNVVGTKDATPSLPTLLKCLMEIVFSISDIPNHEELALLFV